MATQYSILFFPGEFHGQRSLVDYSPRGHKESNMTEQLTHNWGLRHVGDCYKKNGNDLDAHQQKGE